MGLIAVPSFWSSVDLTGNQTRASDAHGTIRFWSSVDLTGNQTYLEEHAGDGAFWSSVDLTGNQTQDRSSRRSSCFGAVSI